MTLPSKQAPVTSRDLLVNHVVISIIDDDLTVKEKLPLLKKYLVETKLVNVGDELSSVDEHSITITNQMIKR